MKNQVKNAPKKVSKIETLKTKLVNAKNSMAIEVIEVASNVKGKDIEKAKRQLSALQVSKISANKVHKTYVGGFNFILNSFKDRASIYLKELNDKNETKFTMSQLMELKPKDLCSLMTDKEKERQAKNGNLWSFWQVETLISRYIKASK